jgi:hypothetical protein
MIERPQLVPISIREADRFVGQHHSHSRPTGGKAKAAIGAERTGQLVGVAILGRPKARLADDGRRLEVVRLCTHGTPEQVRNVASFLLSRCRRLSSALGYAKPPISYLRFDESGVSYKAAGWRCVAEVKADSGDRPSRPRKPQHEIVHRTRWEAPRAA